jgi:hypothetical protein
MPRSPAANACSNNHPLLQYKLNDNQKHAPVSIQKDFEEATSLPCTDKLTGGSSFGRKQSNLTKHTTAMLATIDRKQWPERAPRLRTAITVQQAEITAARIPGIFKK